MARGPWLFALIALVGCRIPTLDFQPGGGSGDRDASSSDGELTDSGLGSDAIRLQLLAGSIGGSGTRDGSAEVGRFFTPGRGVVIDGNLYIPDTNNHTIRVVSSDGTVSTLAGHPGVSGTGDGSCDSAFFDHPAALADSGDGNLIVADEDNDAIREIAGVGTGSCQVKLIAGVPRVPGTNDGASLGDAHFNQPNDLVVVGQLIYIVENGNPVVRVLDAGQKMVATFAGTGSSAVFGKPTGLAFAAGGLYVSDVMNGAVYELSMTGALMDSVPVNAPTGIAFNGSGNLFVTESSTRRVRTIDIGTDNLSDLAGGAGQEVDGTGSAAGFGAPSALATDGGDGVYVSDGNVIRHVTATGVVKTIAGTERRSGNSDGSGSAATFFSPAGVAVLGTTAYVVDAADSVLRVVTQDGGVSTLAPHAGSGSGSAVTLTKPVAVCADGDDAVYIVDSSQVASYSLIPGAGVSVLAGSGTVAFGSTAGAAVGPGGAVFVTDAGTHVIYRVTAGSAQPAFGLFNAPGHADGSAGSASFDRPFGIAADGAGTLYVTEESGHVIRAITNGIVRTIAGTGGVQGYHDATGSDARFDRPQGIAVDALGNLYVADTANAVIRKITPGGVVTTVAGTPGVTGIRLGTSPGFASPTALAIQGTSLIIVDGGAVLALRNAVR